jgi:hypothetical protein
MLCGGCKQQFVAIVDTLTSTARIQNPWRASGHLLERIRKRRRSQQPDMCVAHVWLGSCSDLGFPASGSGVAGCVHIGYFTPPSGLHMLNHDQTFVTTGFDVVTHNHNIPILLSHHSTWPTLCVGRPTHSRTFRSTHKSTGHSNKTVWSRGTVFRR